MNRYNTKQTQKNLRELLDKADGGEAVRIVRGGEEYAVMRTDKLQEFVNELFEKRANEVKQDSSPERFTRTPRDVLDDINRVEDEIKENQGVNQDPDYWLEINRQKQSLWDEYKLLNGDT